MTDIDKLQTMINNSQNIVFFGGAGVSTESGIKDFRSKDGLYHMKYKYAPEEILSHHFFVNNPKDFFEFYLDKMNVLEVKPNIVHNYLVELEKKHKLKGIITQNIDNLHTLAGSNEVIELHGNVNRNYCTKCHKFYNGKYVFQSNSIPTCTCGGIIKPDVVLYEEPLDEHNIIKAINLISNADLLIIAGTSLTVYPASSFIKYFNGQNMVIINRDSTSYDSLANLVINKSLKEVFEQLKNED